MAEHTRNEGATGDILSILERCIADARAIGVKYKYRGFGDIHDVEGIATWAGATEFRSLIEIREQGISPLSARAHPGLQISTQEIGDYPARYHIREDNILQITQSDNQTVLWENLTPPPTLHDLLYAVEDMPSFFRFVAALSADAVDMGEREDHSDEWAQGTIADYLDAALRWAEFTEFGTRNGMMEPPPGWPEQPSWQAFAYYLIMGKIYE
jgi:hypothetical protein